MVENFDQSINQANSGGFQEVVTPKHDKPPVVEVISGVDWTPFLSQTDLDNPITRQPDNPTPEVTNG